MCGKLFSACLRLFIAAALTAALVVETGQAIDDSAVVAYYWQKTARAYGERMTRQLKRHFVLRARTYYHNLDKHGRVTKTDSLLADYYFTGPRVDSQVVIATSRADMPAVDFSIPSIFADPYSINGFPNDTGGTSLAIGFEGMTADDPRPDGLLIIDRNRVLPLWLYAYYPKPGRGKRLSRCFRFTEQQGIVYPDSLWKVAAEPGLLSQKYYRVETGVRSITLLDSSNTYGTKGGQGD
ncbi:MAG: hypothetical protein D6800_08825 [Candidatus Zixiibacteriota bacterium]|nr:MAG: hypothetical protein D6800_08825 [candidate division Zixibacteria bacterium]